MKVRKNPLTLLEIMIVICLIAIISGVVGYNMKGSLEEGKAQKTKLAQEKLKDILQLQMATNEKATLDAVISDPQTFLKHSGLVKDSEALLKDGWGEPFILTKKYSDFKIESKRLIKYYEKKGKIIPASEADFEDEMDY